MPYTPTQQLTAEVLSWPGTSVRLGQRGEYAFDARGRELGHLHGDRVAHFFFDRRLGAELREAGRVGPHPVAPQSVKLGARELASAADVDDVRAMLRLNYERPVRAVVAALDAASEDADATAELLTEDATVVNVAGRRIEGREELRAAMAAALGSDLAQVHTSLEVDSVAFPAEALAIVRATKRIDDRRAEVDGTVHELAPAEQPADDEAETSERGGLPAAGILTLTLVHTGDDWKVAAMQTTPMVAAAVTAR